MPLGGAIIGAAVGLTSLTVGVIQANKESKQQKQLAEQQMKNQMIAVDKTNMANIVIGQGHDISDVFGTTLSSGLSADAQTSAASISKQGNVLVVVGLGVIILSMSIIVLRKK